MPRNTSRFISIFAVAASLMIQSATLFSITVNGSVQPNLELGGQGGSNSMEFVDKINDFNVRQTIANEYYRIKEMAGEKVWLEFHLGFGENTFFSTNTAALSNHSYINKPYDDSTNTLSSINGNLLLKINLFEPKMPYASTLISRLDYLQELMAQNQVSLSPQAKSDLDQIRKRVEAYNSNFWFKRLSVGLGIPFSAFPYPNYPSYDTNNVLSLASHLFHTEDMFAFLGYDLGDVLTLEVGVNLPLNRVFLGASFDISTPGYQFSTSFGNFISSIFGVNAYTPSYNRTLF